MPRSSGPVALWLARLGARSLVGVLLATACSAPAGLQPQQATFAPGQRVASSGEVTLALEKARYDLRRVSVTVSLTNRGKTPVSLEREGILLTYGALEFPVVPSDGAPVAERTTVPPGATVALEFGFGTEQLMVEAATLSLLSLRTANDAWLAPLRLTVPPPAAFVAATQPSSEEPY